MTRFFFFTPRQPLPHSWLIRYGLFFYSLIYVFLFSPSGVSLNVQDLAPSCAGALFGELNQTPCVIFSSLNRLFIHLCVFLRQVSWTLVERSQVRLSSVSFRSKPFCQVAILFSKFKQHSVSIPCQSALFTVPGAFLPGGNKYFIADTGSDGAVNSNQTRYGDSVSLCRGPHGVFLGVSHRGHRLVGDCICPHHYGQPAGPLHLPGLCWGPPGRHWHV